MGTARRTRRGWGLAAFLTGIVGLVVGDVVVSLMHLSDNAAVVVGLLTAIGVVAILTVWLNPAVPRRPRRSRAI